MGRVGVSNKTAACGLNEAPGATPTLSGEAGRKCDGGEEAAEEPDENLDSGYAWLILLVMFLLQSSVSGSSRVYGIVYAKEVAIGYYDREQASWPIATASAVENLAGILTPALVSFLSWRQIELLSTSLFILANLLAYFSDSLTLDIIALGLMQGLALSTYTVLSLVINNDYFERYRTTAYGISMSGSTFGVLYLNPLVTWLLDSYDNFRLVYLALSIVYCFNIILVLFIKPRAKTIKRTQLAATESRRASGSREGQSEIARVKDILEALEPRDQWPGNSGGKRGAELNGTCLARDTNQMTRKRSRLESRLELHLERKSSVASISYLARSRRQSELLKQHFSPADNSYDCGGASKPGLPNSIELPSKGKLESILTKSKSGVELARADGRGELERLRRQRISLNSASFDPINISSSPYEQSKGIASVKTDPSSDSNYRSRTQDQDQTNNYSRNLNYQHQYVGRDTPRELSIEQLRDGQHGGGHELVAQSTLSKSHCLVDCAAVARQKSLVCLDDSDAYKASAQMDSRPAETAGASFSLASNLELLKLPYLHCTWIMLAIYYLVARIFVIILVDCAVDHGFSMGESTSLLNYWSLGELCGRVFLGPLIDLQYMSCKNCIALTCSLLAGAIACIVVTESYVIYSICSLSIAALISLEYMLINVLMVEYLGKDQVTNCYSLAACISSLVLFARPVLIGFFRDHLGSYDGLLILLAALPLAFAILFYVFAKDRPTTSCSS